MSRSFQDTIPPDPCAPDAGRTSGILLHPTSLPGWGIGDLGHAAFRFVDWLVDAGQRYWQILPLVAVDDGGSPYNGLSAMAGNTLLVSPEMLIRDGLLDDASAAGFDEYAISRGELTAIYAWKAALLDRAYERAGLPGGDWLIARREFEERCRGWLPDYALFRALQNHFPGVRWFEWPIELRRRDPEALATWREQLADEINRYIFREFIFERQWLALRSYANSRGVRIIGDVPIFVAYDSADVWAHPELFVLNGDSRPLLVSGVPPDYFSATGQRWGNPLYRWDVLAARGYDWWIERFRRTLELVDVARVDHFRAFEAYWEINADEATAINGRWMTGPGAPFFRSVERQLGRLPLIAEDLGLITPEVERLRDELGYPGMRVFQFAFDGDPHNPHLPAGYPPVSVAYTGTHDNDTIMSWWAGLGDDERGRVRHALGVADPDHWSFVEAVMRSGSRLAVFPLQDVLGLGAEARMNTPGRAADNWGWRLADLPSGEAAHRLRAVTGHAAREVAPPELMAPSGGVS
ncbi:MAG: 4-alpha-glucanotransferase [Gemmatimonadota bacterium]|jgi:4-alpha-glucanotransferase|nr:4-alpha-glucanotransferase [Gemmatimonadota bacterium]